MKLTPEQERRKDEKKRWYDMVGGICGRFRIFRCIGDYYYCECEDIERSDARYEYEVHASTNEKYFSIIYLFCELAVCKCQLRYWMKN